MDREEHEKLQFMVIKTPDKIREAVEQRMHGKIVGSFTATIKQRQHITIEYDLFVIVSIIPEGGKGGRWLRQASITKRLRSSQLHSQISDHEIKCCCAVAGIVPREGAPIHGTRDGLAVNMTQVQDMREAELRQMEKQMKKIRGYRNSDGTFA